MADETLWSDPERVRTAVSGAEGLAPVWEAWNGELAAHQRTLLALTRGERVALLAKPKKYSYDRVSFMRGVAALAHAWMQEPERARDALVLYDSLLEAGDGDASTYCNALWAVQDDNTHLGVDRARAEKYLAAALPEGPGNPAIFFNACCVFMELGEVHRALEQVRAAVAHGYAKIDMMRRTFEAEPLFAPIREDKRFFDALEDRGPQGSALVEQVIAEVREHGWQVLAVPTLPGWPSSDRDFRPLQGLDDLKLPNGLPLPPALRTWLAFDAGWLSAMGWFELEPFRWTPRSLGQIAQAEYGGEIDEEEEDDDGATLDWGKEFDVPRLSHGFLLPGGSDSRRIYMLTDRPDATGEFPVLWTDIDDGAAMGVMYPGFDVWLGEQAGLLSIDMETYSGAFKDRRYRARCLHHAKAATNGDMEVSFPGLGAREAGLDVTGPNWVAEVEALRRKFFPKVRKRIKGATAAELAALEQRLGVPLPDLVRAFLTGVNGLDWGDARFFSVKEMLNDAMQQELAAEVEPPPAGPFAFLYASGDGDAGFMLAVEDGEALIFEVASGEAGLCSLQSMLRVMRWDPALDADDD